MLITANMGVGEDGLGKFFQHQMEVDDTKTNITRAYYKIVDDHLIKNMPQEVLEDMVAKGQAELESREIDDLFDRDSRYYVAKETE